MGENSDVTFVWENLRFKDKFMEHRVKNISLKTNLKIDTLLL